MKCVCVLLFFFVFCFQFLVKDEMIIYTERKYRSLEKETHVYPRLTFFLPTPASDEVHTAQKKRKGDQMENNGDAYRAQTREKSGSVFQQQKHTE